MAGKVTIIGAGAVGASIAYTLTVKGIASEIVLIDINSQKALGEAMDIRQGTPFCDPVKINAGTYPDAKGSDIVILTSGIARKPGQTRLDLSQTNVNIAKSIIPEITKYAPDAIYVIVTDPVDIITYQFHKTSGLPKNQIIGTGTLLDTARLRARIADYYQLAQNNVHAYVFGEHGDSSIVPWSLANIATIPIDKYKTSVPNGSKILPPIDHEETETYMRISGGKIIERKGATYYATAASVGHICECIGTAMDTTLTVSSMLEGEYGISDVCLSMLSVIGQTGLKCRITAPLANIELAALRRSAEHLKDVIKKIKF